MDMSNAFTILAIAKIIIAVVGVIFVFACYRTIKNLIAMIPQIIFDKTKDAYSFSMSIPTKTVKVIGKIKRKARK